MENSKLKLGSRLLWNSLLVIAFVVFLGQVTLRYCNAGRKSSAGDIRQTQFDSIVKSNGSFNWDTSSKSWPKFRVKHDSILQVESGDRVIHYKSLDSNAKLILTPAMKPGDTMFSIKNDSGIYFIIRKKKP